jgi:small subunit ribosomal protein S2
MAEAKKKEVSPKTETKKKSLNVKIPSLEELLHAGVHFGHKKSAWNPGMNKYIYGERNGIHIIDLVKSQKMLKRALEELNDLSQKGSILIVGTKGQAAGLIQEMALEKGAFYVNKRWPGGMFTNFKNIHRSIQKLIKMEEELARGGEGLVKKEILLMERDVERLNRVYEGLKFMDELPKAVIVIDSKVEKNAIREARLSGITTIALVDTNCDPDLVDFPIPANDDSIKSIKLFIDLFGQAIDGSKKMEAVKALRNTHKATLAKLKSDFERESERKAEMEEAERKRMKELREGKIADVNRGVVRVVKKEKDIEADIAAAEEVKENSKSIEELGLSARIEKLLKEAGINKVEDIKGRTKEEVMQIKGIGEKTAEDILKAVK